MEALYINPAYVVQFIHDAESFENECTIRLEMANGYMHWIDFRDEETMYKFINELNFIRVI
jgi:hypothetical protein